MEQLIAFFTDPANWSGDTGILNRLIEHLAIALLAVLVAAAIALPLGFYIGHTGRLQLLGINIANIGRAIPSYAMMVMLLPVMLGLAPVLGLRPAPGPALLPHLPGHGPAGHPARSWSLPTPDCRRSIETSPSRREAWA